MNPWAPAGVRLPPQTLQLTTADRNGWSTGQLFVRCAAMDQQQPSVEEVYRSSRRNCLQHGLVLEALGIQYQIQYASGEYRIVVLSSYAARARTEIEAYAQENRAPRYRTTTIPQRGSGWAGVFGYVIVLLLGFALQHKGVFGIEWTEAGKTHAGLIRAGELWRTVTALSLHSDPAHLMGNIVIGSLIGLFAGQLLGSGLAWISILFAGAGGNLLNAWIRRAGHTSVGASTAVFAALGIVAAYAWIRRNPTRPSALARYAPIVGAVVLLSYLGTGGERTDVLAHVAGFLVGLLLGALFGKLGDRILMGKRAQFLLGIAAVAVLAMAWVVALTRSTLS